MPETPDNDPNPASDQGTGQAAAAPISKEGPETTYAGGNFKRHLPIVKEVYWWVTAIAVVAGICYGAVHWVEARIDKTVEQKLSDETILRKIAAQSRPSLIFDGKESVLSDMGAAQYLKDIRVTRRIGNLSSNSPPTRILIDLNRHFANPPILTALYDSVAIKPERAKGFSWVFEINWIVEAADSTNDLSRAYRLELVP
jgi:hypothetical protein